LGSHRAKRLKVAICRRVVNKTTESADGRANRFEVAKYKTPIMKENETK